MEINNSSQEQENYNFNSNMAYNPTNSRHMDIKNRIYRNYNE